LFSYENISHNNIHIIIKNRKIKKIIKKTNIMQKNTKKRRKKEKSYLNFITSEAEKREKNKFIKYVN
jgi:hypothetical protein